MNCFSRIFQSYTFPFRMADNSPIVLRWVIHDAAAAYARRKAESGVINEGGFKWIIALDATAHDGAKVFLRCGVDHNGPWKCETKANMYVLQYDGNFERVGWSEAQNCFDEINCNWPMKGGFYWPRLEDSIFVINNVITIELHLDIISAERGQPIVDASFFDVPNRKSNVCLNIGEKKLHISKEYLAVHSPVFDTLFFGNFAENGKEEVEIKDVIYEEFVDLLQLIYHKMEITDNTVPHILKLSDQFQMEMILELAKKHLIQSKGIDPMKKLLLADKYRLDSLKDQCLRSLTSIAQVMEKLKSSPEYDSLSGDMKIAIYDRMVKLPLN